MNKQMKTIRKGKKSEMPTMGVVDTRTTKPFEQLSEMQYFTTA